MATAPAHICVYFDDGEPEPACECGSRALYLVEEDGILVALEVDVTVGPARAMSGAVPNQGRPTEGTSAPVRAELAISA
jgi:hypothetical protein